MKAAREEAAGNILGSRMLLLSAAKKKALPSLPFETWSAIFAIACSGKAIQLDVNDDFSDLDTIWPTQIVLLRVCKSWKEVAITTPEIWTSLELGKIHDDQSPLDEAKQGVLAGIFRRILKLSELRPLRLRLGSGIQRHPHWSSMVLDILGQTGRLETVHFDVAEIPDFDDTIILPQLTHLFIENCWFCNLTTVNAPNITSCTLLDSPAPCILFHPQWVQITSLSLFTSSCRKGPDFTMPIDAFYLTVEETPHLITLRVNIGHLTGPWQSLNDEFESPPRFQKQVTLAELRTLELQDNIAIYLTSALSRLFLPALQRVDLVIPANCRTRSSDGTIRSESIQFFLDEHRHPELHDLRICVYNEQLRRRSFILNPAAAASAYFGILQDNFGGSWERWKREIYGNGMVPIPRRNRNLLKTFRPVKVSNVFSTQSKADKYVEDIIGIFLEQKRLVQPLDSDSLRRIVNSVLNRYDLDELSTVFSLLSSGPFDERKVTVLLAL
ncbi:hypothetical protein FA15DRAFT_671864 [Coprinopsis marcescibilis]|uniref:F-box domain-containing protein n=1 Tax=Coprinopsis marcescibilis TaxID=230819 RepID=A0A5C3L1P0_COPMA|nr:hypothetical protein FA15DRAFT_671864 [Coprinopsis marcescibilis]